MFCILIKAWCKQGTPESTRRAEAILEQMEELFLGADDSSGGQMNTYAYNSSKYHAYLEIFLFMCHFASDSLFV